MKYRILLALSFLVVISCRQDDVLPSDSEWAALAPYNCGSFSGGESGYVNHKNLFVEYTSREQQPELGAFTYLRNLEEELSYDASMNNKTIEAVARENLDKLLDMVDGTDFQNVAFFRDVARTGTLHSLVTFPYLDSELARLLWSTEKEMRDKALFKVLSSSGSQAEWWGTFLGLGEVQDGRLVRDVTDSIDRKRIASRINMNCRLVRDALSNDVLWFSLLEHVAGLEVGVVRHSIVLINSLNYSVGVTVHFAKDVRDAKSFEFFLNPQGEQTMPGNTGLRLEEYPHFDTSVELISIQSKKGCSKRFTREQMRDFIYVYTRETSSTRVKGNIHTTVETDFAVDVAELCGSQKA